MKQRPYQVRKECHCLFSTDNKHNQEKQTGVERKKRILTKIIGLFSAFGYSYIIGWFDLEWASWLTVDPLAT